MYLEWLRRVPLFGQLWPLNLSLWAGGAGFGFSVDGIGSLSSKVTMGFYIAVPPHESG